MVSRAPSPENEGVSACSPPVWVSVSMLESKYNDSKGLEFKVELTLQPLPGQKKRANAKPTVKNTSFYVHEDSALNHMLYTALQALGRHEQLLFSFFPQEDKYTSRSIDIPGMTYTIPRTEWKGMSLTCDADYQKLLAQAMKKAEPDVIKILNYCSHMDGDDNESSGEDDATRKHKKKNQKTFEPMEEEVEQNEFIVKLNAEWKYRTSGKHVHLTHMHLQTWAAVKSDPGPVLAFVRDTGRFPCYAL
ncbi:hypothetical protein C8R44DRAFT_887312 [Mycena epipterygia]|nr:hypothetical protein C8R44DRAFT_887312 [Mycena epipterygia]